MVRAWSATWKSAIWVDGLKRLFLESFELHPLRSVGKTKLFQDDKDFRWIRNLV